MSELPRQLRRQAESVVEQSRQEEGTLAAYLLGYAAGLDHARSMISTAELTASFAAFTKRTAKPATDA